MPGPATFAAALEARRRADAAGPLVTFYDDATGERVELSATTYANWVAKTAGLARDELDAERGGLLLVDLPTHWLGAVWLGAAWTVGLCVTDDRGLADEADLVVCGPEGLDRYEGQAARVPVVALSLLPLGGRFTHALPTGVVDYGAVVLAQPDAFMPYDAPEGDDPAWRGERPATQAALLEEAAGLGLLETGGRLLTDVDPCSRPGLRTLLEPLVRAGGTVWVRHPDVAGWAHRAAVERASAQLRAPTS